VLFAVDVLPHHFRPDAMQNLVVIAGGDLVEHQPQQQGRVFILRIDDRRLPQQVRGLPELRGFIQLAGVDHQRRHLLLAHQFGRDIAIRFVDPRLIDLLDLLVPLITLPAAVDQVQLRLGGVAQRTRLEVREQRRVLVDQVQRLLGLGVGRLELALVQGVLGCLP